MPLARRYHPQEAEVRLATRWQEEGTYHFRPENAAPVYAVDTPPATVSGRLHLGHVYSYSHADFLARYHRMRGANVFYPMGFDDNGLPTERLVERQLGRTAEEMGREHFIRACLETTVEFEREYEALWQRLGLSVDWRYTYRTIGAPARRLAQANFLDLLRRDLAYRRQAPAIWCPHCHTAIAQAEVNDLERTSEMVTIPFALEGSSEFEIATTRPELLPACVAVFVHPDDARYRDLAGRQARVPLGDGSVPILTDSRADPAKGTGAVMCCTFGDTTDVEWWQAHDLPLRMVLDRRGRLTAGPATGLPAEEARQVTIERLQEERLVRGRRAVEQAVRVHERCDTPVEYIVTPQWFVRVLDRRDAWLRAGEELTWVPAGMGLRYREWVENLQWDWCISRQRTYGVPFPLWYCSCGKVLTPPENVLPIDPAVHAPPSCDCGGQAVPEEDVMDTWATSSLSPQIAGRDLDEPALYRRIFPMALRPQAHEIIRTWTFYTIVMSHYRTETVPWQTVLISGWGLAPGGTAKISKSRGGGPMAPMAMLERYSADACRYWAASTGPGKDAVISEEKIAAGAKLVTKLWNVAGFAARFLSPQAAPEEHPVAFPPSGLPSLSPADRWLLDALQRLIASVTADFDALEYAAARAAIENFFWSVLADNYLEMAKKRLYDPACPGHAAACFTLHRTLLTTIKLLAPLLPFVTEEMYQGLFATEDSPSIHRSAWPEPEPALVDPGGETTGTLLVAVANAVRRAKSERRLSLGTEFGRLIVQPLTPQATEALDGAEDDLMGVTRAREVCIGTLPVVGAGPSAGPPVSPPSPTGPPPDKGGTAPTDDARISCAAGAETLRPLPLTGREADMIELWSTLP